MPVWPKSFLTLGASALTALTAYRLRRTRRAVPEQQRTFAQLTEKLAETSHWRSKGIEAGISYKKFAERVPPCTYESLAPYVERMKKGEASVLWPGQCSFYAVSSGTTAGRTKFLPITEDMLAHFRHAGVDSLLYYTARVGHAGVFRGRHLFLGGATTLTPIADSQPFEAYAGDLSGITAVNLPKWAEKHLYEPGLKIAQIADWPAKITAIAERTRHRDMSLVGGIPSWVMILADEVLKRSRTPQHQPQTLQEVWPNFECFIHGGVPIGPYVEELRGKLGPDVKFHEIFPASEAFIAVQDAETHAGLRLLTDVGVFYEFLPLADFDDKYLESRAEKVVPLEGVKVGVDYALLMTTPAGLVRYAIGDVVRFTSTEPPRLTYVGRTSLQLSAFGEHVIEKEVTDTLTTVCRAHNWPIVNFHVAPIFVNTLTGTLRGHHEWWIELKPGTVETPIGPAMAVELDAELQRLNEDYEAKRRGGGLEMPVVRLVMPGVFEHWLRYHKKWGGQHKMPRCRSDRTIADELAKITNFAKDQG